MITSYMGAQSFVSSRSHHLLFVEHLCSWTRSYCEIYEGHDHHKKTWLGSPQLCVKQGIGMWFRLGDLLHTQPQPQVMTWPGGEEVEEQEKINDCAPSSSFIKLISCSAVVLRAAPHESSIVIIDHGWRFMNLWWIPTLVDWINLVPIERSSEQRSIEFPVLNEP